MADVAIVLETEPHQLLALQQGLMTTRPEHGNWRPLHVRPDASDRVGACVGLISAVQPEALCPSLRSLPTVWLSQNTGTPLVQHDDAACGRMAAEHLLTRGYGQLLAVRSDSLHNRKRIQAFLSTAREAGAEELYCTLDRLHAMIGQLSQPCAIFAYSDGLAARALQVLLASGIRVPEDIAVLGVNDHPAVVETSAVPLSSVRQDWQGIGHHAGRCLAALLSGKPVPERVVVPPRGVVMRRSTNAVAVDDPAIAQVVRLILDPDRGPWTSETLAREAGISRSTLHRRYRHFLGRGIGADLRRQRLQRACRLLQQSEQPISIIADECGYGHSSSFIAAFREHFGCSPAVWRQEQRAALQ